ncbi:PROTEIN T06D8.7 [Ceraceosorus bombacis]|uniref:PROTEIN T06D8.7 n=1 Tax=Ceraceosorus bombacis TaxID=401625 RepID=A0A0P1BD36_9BASI|nr:PROTEIN T06D8.7 [Ceraceosorus bombacis]
MGLAAFGLFDKEKGEVQCDSPPIPTSRPPTPAAGGPPPPSANKEPLLNVANLSFGTIAGLCSGVFVKKGLKLLAVLLGAAFILLQYLSTQHLISVNWSGIASRYEKAADRAAQQTGNQNAPTSWRDSRLAKIWGRFINFLTTGFQWKASFIAGFGVGFRYG